MPKRVHAANNSVVRGLATRSLAQAELSGGFVSDEGFMRLELLHHVATRKGLGETATRVAIALGILDKNRAIGMYYLDSRRAGISGQGVQN